MLYILEFVRLFLENKDKFFGKIRNGECWEQGDLTTIERGGRCEKEQPKVGPEGARRAGANESLWKLKPSAASLEAETFP